MCWGDMALAPTEAVDAANGVSEAIAAERRAALPLRTWIADWHYRADPNYAPFLPSLQLWKRTDMRPIAAGWYRPDNVRGLATAANIERAGYLQTTWAGYESNEANMLRNFEQFSAMVLAADYTWSDRQEMPDRLGYDPRAVFRELYWPQPSPLEPRRGFAFRWGPETGSHVIGLRRFSVQAPVRLGSRLNANDALVPTLGFGIEPIAASEVSVLVDTEFPTERGEVVAVLRTGPMTLPLRYGIEIGPDAARYPSQDGLTAVTVRLPAGTRLSGLMLDRVSPFAGVRLHAVTVR
jgi:hypothetical protein